MSRRSISLLALVVMAAAPAAVTSAAAADLPVSPAPAGSYYPPSYQPALYNWTGFYLGGNLGLGLLEDHVKTTTTTAFQNAGTPTNLNDLGWMGGFQFGYNYEFTPIVVGVEGTWSGAYLTWEGVIGSQAPPDLQRSYSNEDWFSTVTGRIGYAMDAWLFYARGGAAWMDVRYEQDVIGGSGSVISSQSLNDLRMGFTVGGGVEYGLTEHWSARLEYNFFDFGTKIYNFNNLSIFSGPVGAFPVSINSTVHSLTAGVNFRFN
jgi:outer membrane immunogenic protein